MKGVGDTWRCQRISLLRAIKADPMGLRGPLAST
jgi:hypothetical protein